jgi:crossover junction endodeoxyribonuclease RuvC
MKKRVIGIDPGLANTGFGVVDVVAGRLRLVSYGVIETPSTESHEVRLLAIYNRLLAVLDEFRPDEAEIEALYFSRNSSSALAVAEAKGVISRLRCPAGNTSF